MMFKFKRLSSNQHHWKTIPLQVAAIAACVFAPVCGAQTVHPGEAHYQRVCSDCHDKGSKNNLSKGSPKLGDQRAWESRIKKGIDKIFPALIDAKTHGKPDDGVWQKTNPFIWRDDLTNEQIRSALEYMFAQID